MSKQIRNSFILFLIIVSACNVNTMIIEKDDSKQEDIWIALLEQELLGSFPSDQISSRENTEDPLALLNTLEYSTTPLISPLPEEPPYINPYEIRKDFMRIMYTCPHCKEEFSDKKDLTDDHLKQHGFGVLDVANTTEEEQHKKYYNVQIFPKPSLQSVSPTSQQNPQKFKNFTLQDMWAQFRKDYDSIPQICDQCKKSYWSKQSLETHKKHQHGDKAHICDTCNKKYATNQDLAIHRARNHTFENTPYNLLPWVCNQCPLRYTTKNSLNLHKKRQHLDKIYECSICFRKYVTKKELSQHQRKVHPSPTYYFLKNLKLPPLNQPPMDFT